MRVSSAAAFPRVKWGTKLSLDVIEALRAAAYDRRQDLNEIVENLIRENLSPRYLEEGVARATKLIEAS